MKRGSKEGRKKTRREVTSGLQVIVKEEEVKEGKE